MITLASLIESADGITCDSRNVKPGYIFVAIHGRRYDGNLFAADAERRGAVAVITDHAYIPDLRIPVFKVTNTRSTLAKLAAHFYRHPSRDISVVGVTGTNGKTTVTYMLQHILNFAGFKTGLIGTVSVNVGRLSFPSKLTTPDALDLQNYLAQMRENGVTHAAIEVSAQGVEMHRTDATHFSCGVLTNICPDHLDFHGEFSSYLAAKRKFLTLLDKETPLIANTGDPYCREIVNTYSGRLVTAAVGFDADFRAVITEASRYGSYFEIKTKPFTTIAGQSVPTTLIRIHLPLPGHHNVENALMAGAAALLHGIPGDTIAEALAGFQSVERRMNVFPFNGRIVIDDTALNPGSLDAVFATLPYFRCRRQIVVNAIRGSRGPAINAANAAALAGWQQKLGFSLIVTSSNGSVGTEDAVTFAEQKAFLDTLERYQAGFTYFPGLDAALHYAYEQSLPNDLLALLGAQGMDDGRKILTSSVLSHEQQPEPLSLSTAL